MSNRRVVVTGMGMLTPLGVDMESSWQGLTAGQSGIRPITSFDASEYPVRFGGRRGHGLVGRQRCVIICPGSDGQNRQHDGHRGGQETTA